MGFKIVLALCVMIALASAVPGPTDPWETWGSSGGSRAPTPFNPFAWIPPWITAAPWFPKWSPCTMFGNTCVDCNTKLACTPFGGFQTICSDLTRPYCNLGECSATPSDACAMPTGDTAQEEETTT